MIEALTRFSRIVIPAMLTVICAALGWYGYLLLLDPVSPIHGPSSVRIVDDDGVLERRTLMRIDRRICSRREQWGIVRRSWVDGVVFPAPDVGHLFLAGCHDYDVLVPVPSTLPPGNYSYAVSVMFRNHVGREVTVTLPPVPAAVSAEGWPPLVVPAVPAMPRNF
jgi:hypothetical protein